MNREWGNFEILEVLGEGGMGVVYKARQKTLNRIVALKTLKSTALTPSHLKRFLKEAHLSSKLQHPNLVEVYVADIYQNTPFIAMTYIEGGSFADYCRKENSLEEKLQIIETVARALHYTHKEGIIHRDIKPANILIDKNQNPYITDFGLARTTDIKDRLTKTGETMGTPKYMSPEQVKGIRKEIGPKTDIYALGIILYELATGVSPVDGENHIEIFYQITKGGYAPPSKINKDIPLALEKIILKAIAYDAEKRYRSALNLATDIHRFLEGGKVSPAKKKQKYRILLPVILCSMLICLGFFFFFLKKKQGENLESMKNQYFKLAQNKFKEKKYEKALSFLRKISQQDPQFKKALFLRVKIFEEQNNPDLKICLAQIYKLKDSTSEELEKIAAIACKKGYLENAYEYYSKLIKRQRKNSYYQKRLADLCIVLGRYQQAERIYNKIDKNHQNRGTYLGLAIIAQETNQFEKSYEYLKKIRKHTFYSKAWSIFIHALNKWNSLEELWHYRWLIQPKGKKEIHKKIYQDLKKIDKAFQRANEELRKAPDDYGVKYLRRKIKFYRFALAMEKRNDSKNAIAEQEKFHLQISSNIHSFISKAHFYKISARFLIRHQKWKKAFQICRNCLQFYSWEYLFYYLQGIADFKRGNISPGIDLIHKAIQRNFWNYFLLDTLLKLFFERFTQEEFYEFTNLVYNISDRGDLFPR